MYAHIRLGGRKDASSSTSIPIIYGESGDGRSARGVEGDLRPMERYLVVEI